MKVAIFEDEQHNAERLIQLLHRHDAGTEVVAVTGSVDEGRQWLARHTAVDLLLMDIQLSDGNCFDLFREADVKTPVIFTTAYDNFALQAFKVNSVDYLLKPIDFSELQAALRKFEQSRPKHYPDLRELATAFFNREHTRFTGRVNNQIVYVKASDIAYLHFNKGLTVATTFSNRQIPLDYSLDHIEKLLNRNQFFRINRQFIIHIDAIRKITSYYNSRLILDLLPETGTGIIISRERVTPFKSWLEGN